MPRSSGDTSSLSSSPGPKLSRLDVLLFAASCLSTLLYLLFSHGIRNHIVFLLSRIAKLLSGAL